MIRDIRNGLPQHQLLRNPEMRAHRYLRACINHIAIDTKRGLEICVGFASPPQVKNKSREEQRRWWDDSPRLSEGALVCFVPTAGAERDVLFMTVAENVTDGRRMSRSSSLVPDDAHQPFITLKLARGLGDDLRRMVYLYSEGTQGILVDIPSLIPVTFIHVLQNLQTMSRVGDLTFSQWVVPSDSTRELPPGVKNDVDIPPPAYARVPSFKYRLDSIASSGVNCGLTLDPEAPHAVDLDELERSTGLYKGQCLALVAALTREYALIQGPPGTGKSFLGVKLLQVLLAHKTEANLGPIIIM